MSRLDDFLDWLENQDYWVNNTQVEEKWGDIEFAESAGITVKENEDGDTLIPKLDLKGLALEARKSGDAKTTPGDME